MSDIESSISSLLRSSGHLKSGLLPSHLDKTITYKDKEYESATEALQAYISDFESSHQTGRLQLPVTSNTTHTNTHLFGESMNSGELDFPFLPGCRHRDPDIFSMTTEELLTLPYDGSLPVTHTSAHMHGCVKRAPACIQCLTQEQLYTNTRHKEHRSVLDVTRQTESLCPIHRDSKTCGVPGWLNDPSLTPMTFDPSHTLDHTAPSWLRDIEEEDEVMKNKRGCEKEARQAVERDRCSEQDFEAEQLLDADRWWENPPVTFKSPVSVEDATDKEITTQTLTDTAGQTHAGRKHPGPVETLKHMLFNLQAAHTQVCETQLKDTDSGGLSIQRALHHLDHLKSLVEESTQTEKERKDQQRERRKDQSFLERAPACIQCLTQEQLYNNTRHREHRSVLDVTRPTESLCPIHRDSKSCGVPGWLNDPSLTPMTFDPSHTLDHTAPSWLRDIEEEDRVMKNKRGCEKEARQAVERDRCSEQDFEAEQLLDADRWWENPPFTFKSPVSVEDATDKEITTQTLTDTAGQTHAGRKHPGPVETLKHMLFNLQAAHTQVCETQLKDTDSGGLSIQRALHHLDHLKSLVEESTQTEKERKDQQRERRKDQSFLERAPACIQCLTQEQLYNNTRHREHRSVLDVTRQTESLCPIHRDSKTCGVPGWLNDPSLTPMTFDPSHTLDHTAPSWLRDIEEEDRVMKNKRGCEKEARQAVERDRCSEQDFEAEQLLDADRWWENPPVTFKSPVSVEDTTDKEITTQPLTDKAGQTHAGRKHPGPVETLKHMLFNLQAAHTQVCETQMKDTDSGGLSIQRALHHLDHLKSLVEESTQTEKERKDQQRERRKDQS